LATKIIRDIPMNIDEFNSTVVRTDYPDFVEWDLLPFGARQAEALDFYLDAALSQSDLPDESRWAFKVNDTVILSDRARALLTQLRERGISLTVILDRP
jgi:hypothetical protein